MIFEKDNLRFSIISLTELYQENVTRHSDGRSFDALSFRFRGDTDLVTEKGTKHVSDNYLCFVPKNLAYDRIAKVDDLIAINFRVENYSSDDIECFLPGNPKKIARLFKDFLECRNKKEPGYHHRSIAYFHQILAECCKQNVQTEPKESKIQDSVTYINANYTKSDLQIKEIASKSFMSEVYFRKIFKDEYGISPQKYIIKLRLQKAAELIETGDYSLKEIAVMTGYNDYKYFSSEFKQFFGTPPSEYKVN